MLSILFITVVVGVKLTQLVTFPDGQDDLRIGLIIFFAMPTTITTGMVLTQQCNGNYALVRLPPPPLLTGLVLAQRLRLSHL